MVQIIDAYLGLTALRQAGYRTTATAVAELVDNSIEAGATKIDIVAVSRTTFINARNSNQVERIAVLDNGCGMPPEILENCLSLGWGTRLNTRDGLGRFGFGLKGSSISQARRVVVYSWVKPNEIYRACLDLDEIKDQKLTELPGVAKAELPADIRKCFEETLSDSGTLVLWEDLDQMDLRRAETMVQRVNSELCRIYRHFLDDCDVYGNKRAITIHLLQADTGKVERSVPLRANDPLYLLHPNNLPGYENEATNVLFCDPFSIPIKYRSASGIKESKIEFIFTIANPSIQNLSGNSPQGKHYGKNTGISFVRAGREIDFGSFGFLDSSEPRHRWWGAEVRFNPELDELFGVTNNKQEVRAIKKLEKDYMISLAEELDEENYRSVLQFEINKILSEHVAEMMKVITGRRSKQREVRLETGLTDKINKDIQVDKSPTESEVRAAKLSDEVKLNERVALLLADDSTLTEDEARDIAKQTLDYKVDIQTGDWPGELFLDRRPVANASVGIVNRRTQFYEKFWLHLERQEDRKGFEALEVLMMALVRSEDELVREYDRQVFERFRSRWGSWVEKLIQHAGS
jgi:hypothetical protein